jgi:NAD(P)-dependent dehydrogenase (short-subunit alcohol dehydrogenase family)
MDNIFSLRGKTILVTGASSGIGFETCKTIAALGGNVIATARNEENLKSLMAG